MNKKELNYMEMNDILLKHFEKAEKQALGKDRPDRFFIKEFIKSKDLIDMIYLDIIKRVNPEALEKFEIKAKELIESVESNEKLVSKKNKVAYLIYHYKAKIVESYQQKEIKKRNAYLMGSVCLSIICFKHCIDNYNIL